MAADASAGRSRHPAHDTLHDAVHRAIGPQYLSAVEDLLAGEAPAVTALRAGVDPAAVPVLLWLAAAKLLDALAPGGAPTPCPRCGR